ncbi:hypothetical protein SMICM17S_07576 [Streptomyces microflavus]
MRVLGPHTGALCVRQVVADEGRDACARDVRDVRALRRLPVRTIRRAALRAAWAAPSAPTTSSPATVAAEVSRKTLLRSMSVIACLTPLSVVCPSALAPHGQTATGTNGSPRTRTPPQWTSRPTCPKTVERYGAGSSASSATSSRWLPAEPYARESALARLRYRCAGCSQVMPIPPCSWTHSSAACTATPEQYAWATAVRRGLLAGAGLLASEQLGIAERCLTETVRHTRERHQFNRPVGSFQALKHRMAQLWLEVVSARAAARNAADALATGSPDAPLAVAVAQAYCSGVAVHAAEECVQLHGGIGMTWEHPAHLYLKRAKADSLAYGSAGSHREEVAELAELPAP